MSNVESLYNGPFCEPPVDAGMREGLVDLDETVLEYHEDTAERDGAAEDLNERLGY